MRPCGDRVIRQNRRLLCMSLDNNASPFLVTLVHVFIACACISLCSRIRNVALNTQSLEVDVLFLVVTILLSFEWGDG